MPSDLSALRKFLTRAVDAAHSDDPQARPDFHSFDPERPSGSPEAPRFAPMMRAFHEAWARHQAAVRQAASVSAAMLVGTAVILGPGNALARHNALSARVAQNSLLVFESRALPSDSNWQAAEGIAEDVAEAVAPMFIRERAPHEAEPATLTKAFGPFRCDVDLIRKSRSAIDGDAPTALVLLQGAATCLTESRRDVLDIVNQELQTSGATVDAAAQLVVRHAMALTTAGTGVAIGLRALDEGGRYDLHSRSSPMVRQIADKVIARLDASEVRGMEPVPAGLMALDLLAEEAANMDVSAAAAADAVFSSAPGAGQSYLRVVESYPSSAEAKKILAAINATLMARFSAVAGVAKGDQERALPIPLSDSRKIPLESRSGSVVWVALDKAEAAVDRLAKTRPSIDPGHLGSLILAESLAEEERGYRAAEDPAPAARGAPEFVSYPTM